MNLPNYFLADLPPEATLSPTMIAEACQTLKRNREHYLTARSTENLIKILSRVADGWLAVCGGFKLKLIPLDIGGIHLFGTSANGNSAANQFFNQLFGDKTSKNALCQQTG